MKRIITAKRRANGQRSTVIAGGGKIPFESVSEVNFTYFFKCRGFILVMNKYDIDRPK